MELKQPQAKVSPTVLNASGKMLRVLEVLAQPPHAWRLRDIVVTSGVGKTSVHRLLTDLIHEGYASRNTEGLYTPGTGLRVLAASMTPSSDERDEIRDALTSLRDRVDQTVHMALRSGTSAIYTYKLEPAEQAVRMASKLGTHLELHCTAIGKAIMAHIPEREVWQIARTTGLPARTTKTITTMEALLKDGETVRSRGYAIDDEENELPIRCIAAPVFDGQGNPIGGISISTLAPLVDLDSLIGFAPHLIRTAATVTKLSQ